MLYNVDGYSREEIINSALQNAYLCDYFMIKKNYPVATKYFNRVMALDVIWEDAGMYGCLQYSNPELNEIMNRVFTSEDMMVSPLDKEE